jgi:hypothetical protein
MREELNPFTAAERMYPIDFGMLTDHLVINRITIPDGYELEKLPEDKAIALPENAAKATFSFTIKENTLIVMTRLQINSTLFQPEDYASLKEFHTRLITKKGEIVVLKKL